MNIQQIRYFSKVYETSNYARAAEQLFISRQALRKAIQGLELELGQELFVSYSNVLHPTAAAYDFYQASREALKAFGELEEHVKGMRGLGDETINFGISYGAFDVFSFEERLLFTEPFPGTVDINFRLKSVEGTAREICDMVLDGRLDYGNVIDVSINDTLFDYEIACEGDLYLAVREDDPLASRESVQVSDLKGRNFGTQGPDFGIHRLLASEANKAGFELNVAFVGATQSTMLCNAESGHTVCYAYSPKGCEAVAPHVKAIPFKDPTLHWKYYSICRKGMGDPYLLRYFAGKEVDWGIEALSDGHPKR